MRLGPSAHFPPRLNQGLNRARRGDLVAVQFALEVGALIGVHYGGDAHDGQLPSKLFKLGWVELVAPRGECSMFRLIFVSPITSGFLVESPSIICGGVPGTAPPGVSAGDDPPGAKR